MFVPFREMPSGLASQRPTSPGTCRAPRCPAPSVLSTPRWGVRDSRGKRKPRINRSAQTTISSASSMPSHYPAPSRPKPAWPLAPKGPRLATPGRVAQWESARFTRERTVVRNHPRPLSEAPASAGGFGILGWVRWVRAGGHLRARCLNRCLKRPGGSQVAAAKSPAFALIGEAHQRLREEQSTLGRALFVCAFDGCREQSRAKAAGTRTRGRALFT